MTDTFIKKGGDTLAALEAANSEQERLKAALKTATAKLEKLQKELTDWHSEAMHEVVKLAYRGEKEKWVEFGIKAKR